MSEYYWLTTSPNPRVKGCGADDGQRGWRTHAVEAIADASWESIRFVRSACGLMANHGWGMDMFIDHKCARCMRALTKMAGVNPESPREQVMRRLLTDSKDKSNG